MVEVATKHAKVVTTMQHKDGTQEIKTESFYEELANRVVEIEKKRYVALDFLLQELIAAAGMVKDGTSPKVTITIEAGDKKEFVKLTKRYVSIKESFKKR